MRDNGLKPFLYTKTRAVFSRFTSVETILSALASRNPASVLAVLDLDERAPTINGLSAGDAELVLHKHFVMRLSRAIPRTSYIFPLFHALVMEYEIRNIALFLKLDSDEIQHWYPLAPGCGIFGEKMLSLSRDTVNRMLERSRYQDAARVWNETHDTSRLDAALERIHCHGLEQAINEAPRADRHRLQTLYHQRLSLKFSLEALRMQRSYGAERAQILSRLPFPDNQIRAEIITLLDTPSFEHPLDALPQWARPRAKAILASRPDLIPRNPDPELGLNDLSMLEKLAANLMLTRYRHEYRNYGDGYAPIYCFYYLFKRELQNLMLLLNGIRFNIGPEILRAELVW